MKVHVLRVGLMNLFLLTFEQNTNIIHFNHQSKVIHPTHIAVWLISGVVLTQSSQVGLMNLFILAFELNTVLKVPELLGSPKKPL